jgi:uncharacterized protein (TIGR02452 family)
VKRASRQAQAQETLAIVAAGHYTAPNGRVVELGPALGACLARTGYYPPDVMAKLASLLPPPLQPRPGTLEVTNETTLAAIARVQAEQPGPLAALNFASAKNPGGGFLNGSQAQEESLARSSALYASQQRAEAFYALHRTERSLLYTDAAILSPACPIFRHDDGTLLDTPQFASFITCAAPNAGALAKNQPADVAALPATFARRCEVVLALTAARAYRRLILGAWGCGVFRNDPGMVAGAFAELLRGTWALRFERIVFAVYDTSKEQATFRAFQRALLGG